MHIAVDKIKYITAYMIVQIIITCLLQIPSHLISHKIIYPISQLNSFQICEPNIIRFHNHNLENHKQQYTMI